MSNKEKQVIGHEMTLATFTIQVLSKYSDINEADLKAKIDDPDFQLFSCEEVERKDVIVTHEMVLIDKE